jgi:tetratricopeptide (TPR) repeat protein
MRTHISLEELFRLLPRLDELDVLRASIMSAAVPDPQKEWASSSSYTTVDKRVLSRETVNATLAATEAALTQHVARTFAGIHDMVDHYWAGDEGATACELIAMGEQEEARSQLARARVLYATALSMSMPLAEKAPQILALRRVARVLFHEGEFQQARDYYARSAELARAAGESRSEVIACTGMGNVLVLQGRWAEAEACYRAALALIDASDAQDLKLERGQIYNNLGSVTMRLARLEEAEEWLSRARELWQWVDSPADLAICCHHQGLLRIRQGRLSEAKEVLLAALDLPSPRAVRSVVATDLSDLFLREGRLTQAEEWGREAETHAIASGSPYQMSHMYGGLGNIARARGDEGGITFFEKAIEIARASGQAIAEGEALMDYALLRADIGQSDEAISYLERAREIFIDLGAEHDLARLQEVEAEVRSHLPLAAAGD